MRFKLPFNKCLVRMVEGVITTNSGKVIHYHDGRIHRLDGPAILSPDGRKEWNVNGTRHRLDGPAIETAGGSKHWYADGVRHRIDGPAVELADGRKIWYRYGELHRTDGPAIEEADGTVEWFINGTQVDISLIDYAGSRPLTDEEITYLLLAS